MPPLSRIFFHSSTGTNSRMRLLLLLLLMLVSLPSGTRAMLMYKCRADEQWGYEALECPDGLYTDELNILRFVDSEWNGIALMPDPPGMSISYIWRNDTCRWILTPFSTAQRMCGDGRYKMSVPAPDYVECSNCIFTSLSDSGNTRVVEFSGADISEILGVRFVPHNSRHGTVEQCAALGAWALLSYSLMIARWSRVSLNSLLYPLLVLTTSICTKIVYQSYWNLVILGFIVASGIPAIAKRKNERVLNVYAEQVIMCLGILTIGNFL